MNKALMGGDDAVLLQRTSPKAYNKSVGQKPGKLRMCPNDGYATNDIVVVWADYDNDQLFCNKRCAEIYFGYLRVNCGDCEGRGYFTRNDNESRCQTCDGTGMVPFNG